MRAAEIADQLTDVLVTEEEIQAKLEELARRVEADYEGKDLLLVQTEAQEEETQIETDAGLLGQIVSNLLDNACKYSREASDHRVWLRSRVCRAEGKLVIEVEDRGPGVAVKERRTIFRPFRRRGGQSGATTTGGVGLGLSVSRELARLLGGDLAVDSELGEGATFRLELPLNGDGASGWVEAPATDQVAERA